MALQFAKPSEEAKLLGFDSHADFILDIRMAKNSANVFKFLHGRAWLHLLTKDLTAKLDKPARSELAKLAEMKKVEKESRNEPFDGKCHVWDWRYYDNMM